jgi:hypothetical protein
MGAIAEALVSYAQPLLDQTDGSIEQMNHALSMSQLCYNLGLLPEDAREQVLSEMRLTLKMDDEEFEIFRSSVVTPMLERYQEMFAGLHERISNRFLPTAPSSRSLFQGGQPRRPGIPNAAPNEDSPGVDRYAPCPCNSGRKYKFCCAKKSF